MLKQVKERAKFWVLCIQERSFWAIHQYACIAQDGQFLDQWEDVFRLEKLLVWKLVVRYIHKVLLSRARGQALLSRSLLLRPSTYLKEASLNKIILHHLLITYLAHVVVKALK